MKRTITAAVAALVMSGCTTYSKYSRPDNLVPEALYGTEIQARDSAGIAAVPWREFFRDSRLQALVDTGLARNADLRIASLRVKEAEASLLSARLAYLPAVSLAPQGSLSKFGSGETAKTYSLGLSADWELDIAGRITNGRRGALASLREQENARQAVASQLVATIANTYYSLLMLDEQAEMSRASLRAWDEIVRTLEARLRVGESDGAAVAQARASRLGVESSLLSLELQTRELENSMNTLLGRTPQEVERGSLSAQTFPDSMNVGVPLRLLENRPDIRQAEYALESAFYAVNVARAAFYPSLTLGGTIGWTNNSGAEIVNPGKWLMNALASLAQPLFNRGRNTANLRIAKARQEEALESFRQKLLEAGAEVNNALAQWQTAQKRLEVDRRQIAELEKAVEGTRLLMLHSDNGSYLEVLTAEQTLLSARLAAAQDTFDKIQGVIKLYHALGGGE